MFCNSFTCTTNEKVEVGTERRLNRILCCSLAILPSYINPSAIPTNYCISKFYCLALLRSRGYLRQHRSDPRRYLELTGEETTSGFFPQFKFYLEKNALSGGLLVLVHSSVELDKQSQMHCPNYLDLPKE